MTKKMWDLYAPIYERAMRSDRKTNQFMYDRIPESIRNKDVLEIATGPGLLAKHVASASKTMIATDYSEGMIAQATKGVYPTKLRFEVADATALSCIRKASSTEQQITSGFPETSAQMASHFSQLLSFVPKSNS